MRASQHDLQKPANRMCETASCPERQMTPEKSIATLPPRAWGRLRVKAAMYGPFAFFTMLSSKYSAGSFCGGSACDAQRMTCQSKQSCEHDGK